MGDHGDAGTFEGGLKIPGNSAAEQFLNVPGHQRHSPVDGIL
jgi:hypothetical protein